MSAGFFNIAPVMARRFAGVALTAAIVAAGCRAPPPKDQYAHLRIGGGGSVPQQPAPTIDPTTFATHDDIFQIVAFWVPPVWLFESSRQPVGFKSRVYFMSAADRKGVFVSGPISVTISRLRRAGRRIEREQVHEWNLNSPQALGYRITKEGQLGLSYGFMLRWPDEVDVFGSQIEIVISYTRADGRVVRSSAKRLRVPVPDGYIRSANVDRG